MAVFLVPPQITYLKNQTASEFDELVTLTCEASGDPTPTISWSFEDRVFTEGEQVGVPQGGAGGGGGDLLSSSTLVVAGESASGSRSRIV